MDDKAKIQEAIKMQGEVVRKLKAVQGSKDQVSVRGWGLWNPDFSRGDPIMSSFNMDREASHQFYHNPKSIWTLKRYSLFYNIPTIVSILILYLSKTGCHLSF